MTPEQKTRYDNAQHKIQTLAAYEYGQKLVADQLGHREFKYLRVGLNSFARDHASLAGLLISKGVITEEEYYAAMVDGMEQEAAMYERNLRKEYNVPDNVTFA